MDHPDFIACIFMENSIGMKRDKDKANKKASQYHNHTPQTNPRHSEEEPQNT